DKDKDKDKDKDDDKDKDEDEEGEFCTPSECLSPGITPLQNTKSTIQAAINNLTGPKGVTIIPQGLVWAWRVLMPEAPFTEATANPDPVPYRAIVLLTDGENYGSATREDAYQGAFGGGAAAQAELDARLIEIADKIKATGTRIYTIQFTSDDSDLEALLQTVASGTTAPYFHNAPDADALEDVFIEIGEHVAQTHLTQ
ncbi:MAG: VWA domain-containing protein, partial [Kiloniellales bacterium]|nr:VWA domain-containing protein [Kiloniellales bacterium]